MDPTHVQLVHQSLGRCLLNNALGKSFLDAFYDEFIASDPRIKRLFANTDMKKQKDLLRQGLVMLVMYAKDLGLAKSGVEQLASKHDRNRLNVDPSLYPLWVRSLLACIKKYDREHDARLLELWTEVLNQGINVMKAAY